MVNSEKAYNITYGTLVFVPLILIVLFLFFSPMYKRSGWRGFSAIFFSQSTLSFAVYLLLISVSLSNIFELNREIESDVYEDLDIEDTPRVQQLMQRIVGVFLFIFAAVMLMTFLYSFGILLGQNGIGGVLSVDELPSFSPSPNMHKAMTSDSSRSLSKRSGLYGGLSSMFGQRKKRSR